MEITAAQAYGILSIEDNCILSKDGSITIVFGLKMSEAYTMDASGFDDRHNHYYRAFSHIKYGYVHKQDVFLKQKFDSSAIGGSSIYNGHSVITSMEGNIYSISLFLLSHFPDCPL